MAPLKTPLWRYAIISLLLWALPLQWLASAATLPCAAEVHAKGDVALVSVAQTLTPFAQPAVIAPAHGHQHDAQSNEKHAAHEGHEGHDADAGTSAPAHTQCAGAGHCCLSMALVAPAMPDFARRSASQQCAALAQPHRTPLLSGPDRPPQTHAA
jgi:hypothetical protein